MPQLSAISQKGSAAAGTDKIVLTGGVYVPASEVSGLGCEASAVVYDNALSGLTAITVQQAVDEIVNNPPAPIAADVPYDNAASGLVAMDVQAAIDELADSSGNFTGGSLTSALNEAKATDIASASTTDIGSATGNLVHVTGTTTITDLGTAQAGSRRIVVFDGVLTLTHNGTSLILPTGANITTAPGDSSVFVSEGSGNWRCTSYLRANGTSLAGGGGLTYITEALTTSSPYATVNLVSLTVTGGSTNASFAYIPKGTGAFQLSNGGNSRGANAADLQMVRASAAQVASGSSSFAAGQNNTSSGTATIALGDNNSVSGTNCVAAGYLNIVSGTQAIALGRSNTSSARTSSAIGESCVADSDASIATGRESSAVGIYGKRAHGSGRRIRVGGNQSASYVLRGGTTNATPVVLTTNSSAASASNQVVLSNSSQFVVKGTIQARQQTTGDGAAWDVTLIIKRNSNAASTTIVAGGTPTLIGSDVGASAWTIALTADTTNGGLAVTVTGEASKSIEWNAALEVNELITA